MRRLHTIFTITFITALSAVGCTANTGGEPESVGQSNDALSVYQWSNDIPAGSSHSFGSPAIATYTYAGAENTVMVHSSATVGDTSLWWAISYDGTSWTNDAQIPAMSSGTPPRIAAFNGYLYMVHTGATNSSVWMARFNPNTKSWGQHFLLPYSSTGSPALAAYNGSLYIIGTTPGSQQLWQATMSTAEVFSAQSDIPGQISPSGPPGITSHCLGTFCTPTLFIAYRSSAGEVTMSGLQATFSRWGSPSWWTPWIVTNTDGSHKSAYVQPALASFQGMLHMVYTTASTGDYIKWTYYDGANWSPDVSITTQEMAYSASLSPRSNVLTMVHNSSFASQYHNDTQVYSEYFH